MAEITKNGLPLWLFHVSLVGERTDHLLPLNENDLEQQVITQGVFCVGDLWYEVALLHHFSGCCN